MEVSGKRIDSDDETNAYDSAKKCELCQVDNIFTLASGICKDCGECMCNACFRQHLRLKSCRDHVLVDLTLPSVPSISADNCKQHNGEKVKFYCRKHDVVACGDCIVHNHGTCQPEFIKNLSKDIKESSEFKHMTGKIKKSTSLNKEIEDVVEENKTNNKIMLEKAIDDIRKFRIDINKYLDRVEAEAVSEVKRIKSLNDKLLADVEQECQLLSSKMKEIQQMMDIEALPDNMLFINVVECKPKVSEIEKALAEVQSKKLNKFQFVCEQDLRSIITSAGKFGTVDITSAALHHQTSQTKEPWENVQVREQITSRTDENTQRGRISVPRVVVGARVRHNTYLSTGIVTAVHPDGTVNVRWGDVAVYVPYSVGTGPSDLTLI